MEIWVYVALFFQPRKKLGPAAPQQQTSEEENLNNVKLFDEPTQNQN